MSELSLLPGLSSLPTATLTHTFVARERVALGEETTSAWRGQLGRYLYRVSPPDASGGSLYSSFFSTPSGVVPRLERIDASVRGWLGLGGSHVPHPFILRGRPVEQGSSGHAAKRPSESSRRGLTLEPGETYELQMVLVGSGIRYLPALCGAIDGLDGWTIGKRVRQRSGGVSRGRVRLSEVALEIGRLRLRVYDGHTWSLPPSEHELLALAGPVPHPPQVSGELEVHLQTPLRLTASGERVRAEHLTSEILAQAALRRLAALSVCYGTGVTSAAASADASAASSYADILSPSSDTLEQLRQETAHLGVADINVRSLHWCSRSRYSGRQRRRITTHGLAGSFTLKGSDALLADWGQLLSATARVHVGKGTSLGHGWTTLVAGPGLETESPGRSVQAAPGVHRRRRKHMRRRKPHP